MYLRLFLLFFNCALLWACLFNSCQLKWSPRPIHWNNSVAGTLWQEISYKRQFWATKPWKISKPPLHLLFLWFLPVNHLVNISNVYLKHSNALEVLASFGATQYIPLNDQLCGILACLILYIYNKWPWPILGNDLVTLVLHLDQVVRNKFGRQQPKHGST